MDLTEIMSISGKPGLYKMISHTKTGMLVESMADQKRFPVFSHEKVSSLEEISIFAETDDIPLKEVFQKIHNMLEGEKALSHKSTADELKDFFDDVVPDYDKEQVYVSDIKKVIQWYNILHEKEMLDFTEDEETGEQVLVNTADEKFRNTYKIRTNKTNDDLLKKMKKLKIDIIQLNTDDSFYAPLRKFFALRKKRLVR